MMRWVLRAAIILGSFSPAFAQAADRAAWTYTPPQRPVLPPVRDHAWPQNAIDLFILARLEATGLGPSRPADRLTWLRRVTFDLTGLPPTRAEQDAFVADQSPDAYERVVERLLASPHYGERWAQHWLDLVRYAETDGFKADETRPAAHRYRDYVIRALNADLPYDRFIRQQLAGDELEPQNVEALLATGFNRLWPDEYNAANLEQRRQEILDDATDVTALAFLGLTFGCARCHDHKFDPITQEDYFRLQAFFAPMLPRDDRPAATPEQVARYEREHTAWLTATRELRAEMDRLLASKRAELRKYALTKFRTEIQEAFLTPKEKRTPYQEQIAAMAEKQCRRAEEDAPKKLALDKRARYQELERALAKIKPPAPLPVAMTVADQGTQAPPTYRLLGGDWRKPRKELQPGFPDFLPSAPVETQLTSGVASTGRRTALARWLTRPDHPLTARVIVNRLWQHHFGRGIVGTPSDFGSQGEPPTHPELLDWLAVDFMDHGWSLKHLHRQMALSAAYRQTSLVDPTDKQQALARTRDPENKLLWHARRRRLEGEAIRDALLQLAQRLNVRMFGASALPRLPERLSSYAWKPDTRVTEQDRRSAYVFVKRNLRYPFFDAFDWPDLHNSCARRTQTVTAPQALALLNNDLTLACARRWAESLRARYGDDLAILVAEAYRTAWGRPATDEEVRLGVRFVQEQARRAPLVSLRPSAGATDPGPALADFCHAVLIANEFLYID
jgi:hypothetical protein